jgi:hypothetical protein
MSTKNPLVFQGKRNHEQQLGRGDDVRHDFEKSGGFIGLGGMFVALFLYGYTAIALPSWLHSLVMPLVWLVLFALSCAWFTRRPKADAVLPVIAIVLWFGAVLLFGPTA